MTEDRLCAREGCENMFTPKSYNARYCSLDCQKLATNARMMQRYYEKKAIRGGKKRVCLTPGCNTLLSRYNTESVCQKCVAEQESARRVKLLEMLDNVKPNEEA